MAGSGKSSNITFRVALVSVGFIAGLAAVALVNRDEADKVAVAFADARAAAGLQRPADDIDVAAMALRGKAVELRSTRAGDSLKAFADAAKALSGKIDTLASSSRADPLAKPISDLKAQVAAIGKAFDAVQQAQQTAGDSPTIGVVGKAVTDAQTLIDDTASAFKDSPTLEGEQMRRAAMAMARAQLQYEATLDDHVKSDFDAAAADFNAVFAAASVAQDAKDTLNLDVNNFVDAFKEASAAELAYSQATDALVKAFDPLVAPIKDLGDAVAATGAADGGLAAAQADAEAMIDLAALIAIVIGLISIVLVAHSLAKPLRKLDAAMSRLAGGDLAVEPPALGRSGLYASIARAFERIKQAMVEDDEQARAATARRETRLADEAVRRETEAEREAAAREQERTVSALAEACERLSEGNLTFRISAEFPPAYQKVKDDFNGAIAQMQRAVAVISDSVRGIRVNAEAVAHASGDLSRRTEEQAATLEETASALGEITQTVKKAAEFGAARARGRRRRRRRRPEGRGRRQAGGRRDGRHRQIGAADHPHHRRDRRDRLPDQPARAQRRRRSGARRRRGTRFRRRRVGSARAGATLGRGGQGDQGAHLGLDRPGRPRRRIGRRDRRGARAHHGPGRRSQRGHRRASRPARENSRPVSTRSTSRSAAWIR